MSTPVGEENTNTDMKTRVSNRRVDWHILRKYGPNPIAEDFVRGLLEYDPRRASPIASSTHSHSHSSLVKDSCLGSLLTPSPSLSLRGLCLHALCPGLASRRLRSGRCPVLCTHALTSASTLSLRVFRSPPATLASPRRAALFALLHARAILGRGHPSRACRGTSPSIPFYRPPCAHFALARANISPASTTVHICVLRSPSLAQMHPWTLASPIPVSSFSSHRRPRDAATPNDRVLLSPHVKHPLPGLRTSADVQLKPPRPRCTLLPPSLRCLADNTLACTDYLEFDLGAARLARRRK
ncbi:hypothetical protein OH76DRAFT_1490972 [Lentinus brumalis]|uniref:Uncharacterized protein n=1 Tax=Lentinus brumalis TaxID=2498619 RepID=A0A371CH53_9APHY|nr:hypothetical protein OH76DRAFT_1490972 [Polyporus brumalis]